MGNEECCCVEKSGICTGDEMTDMMLSLADKAWEKLMIEKMKKALDAEMGKRMDGAAQAAVKASIDYWNRKMEGEAKKQEYVKSMQEAFAK